MVSVTPVFSSSKSVESKGYGTISTSIFSDFISPEKSASTTHTVINF